MKSFKQYLTEAKKIIVYHYTHAIHFAEFQQLSHFGTLNAAVTMSVNDGKRMVGIPRVLEVELTLDKTYRLTYAEEEDDAKLYWNMNNTDAHPELKKAWTDDIFTSIQAFKKLGYDSIVYANHYDDDGSDSYIIFYPHQAKVLKVLAQKKPAIKRLQRKLGWED
jgi:hypothetical protein